MHTIIFALWILLTSYSFNLNALDYTQITYRGTGCPPGSIVFESADGLPTVAHFSSFSLNQPRSFMRATCSFALPVKGQPGMQASISTITAYGSHSLPLNAGGEISIEAFFAGTSEPAIINNYAGSARFYSLFEPTAWSPCGADTIARVNISMIVRNQSSNPANMQIATIGTRPLPFFKMNWRSCASSNH